MPDARRILDANANRAREALRVMEDGARFLLNDERLTRELKAARHDLRSALSGIDLTGSRDTPGDVGTAVSTDTEMVRTDTREVVVAAGKRLSEALRSIEEYAKTIDPDVAHAVERIRYRGYELERRLVVAMPTGGQPQWRLCVLITGSLCTHHPWEEVATRTLGAGADCLQLREKDLETGELCRRAERLLALAAPTGAHVVVNDRVDVALATGAHGVHLGRTDLPIERARAIAGERLLIGASTSTVDEALAAQRAGADNCGVGPMFPTTTKHKPVIAGPGAVTRYVAHDPPLPPHLAIGGITPANIREVVEAGARGVAVSSCVCAAEDPAEATTLLIEALESVRT
ncbi:MAG: thiamine phosphate synthase [Planctomycetota bacterium]